MSPSHVWLILNETSTSKTFPRSPTSFVDTTEPSSGTGLGTSTLRNTFVATFVTVNWPTIRVNVLVNRKPLAVVTCVNWIGAPQGVDLPTRYENSVAFVPADPDGKFG